MLNLKKYIDRYTEVLTNMKRKIISVSNKYFTGFASVQHIIESKWHSVGELMRNDTSEMLPRRYGASGDSEQSALAEISRRLSTVLQEMGEPYDWGAPDKVRQILWKYLEFWDERNWNSQSGEKLKSFEEKIVSELELISEEDQVRLLTASDYAYNNPVRDSDNLNENSARYRLFELINNPSVKVKQAIAMHEQRLLDLSVKEQKRIRLESISTHYFTAFVSAVCVSPDDWIATGELMRRDTFEMCPRRIEAKGNNEKNVLDAAMKTLKNILMNSESPTDWGKADKLRQLLWRYIEFHRGPVIGRRPSDEECEKIEVGFASEIILLTEEEQVRLFTEIENNCNVDDECNTVDSIVNFHEFHAQMRLFELIENPTEKVNEAFKKRVRDISKARDKQKLTNQ